MISRLIRIYTPFVCALAAVIHGVLFLLGYSGIIYTILNDITGHSFLLVLYIICSSKKMCKWYKLTNYLLLSIHIVNMSYTFGVINYYYVSNLSIVINIIALISFLIYRITAGVTKVLC